MNPYTSSSKFREAWQRETLVWRIMLGVGLIVLGWALYIALTSGGSPAGHGTAPGSGGQPLELPRPAAR
jgi:hypothetical protein